MDGDAGSNGYPTGWNWKRRGRKKLTLDHVWLLALGGDKLQVQRLGARRTDLAEDEGPFFLGGVRAGDANDVRAGRCHG